MNNADTLKSLWPMLKRVQWVHSLSAGVENICFPALVESPVPVTNARGVFKRSLGEFTLAAIFFFAKDLRRMLRNQAAERWEQFDIEEVHGRTLGVVGYGELGRAAAERAHAMGMRIIALRRRPELSKDDPIVDKFFSIEDRARLMEESDYVVAAAPQTPETLGLVGEKEIRAMKATAVVINIGRGSVIDEPALIRALQENRIRGAALDVFATEPLPAGHPFWKLENVLISPHCADHTSDWLDRAMDLFVTNFERFQKGESLLNVIDKRAGY
jgi:phosphoglycerate dehydrogenase-like enzyme